MDPNWRANKEKLKERGENINSLASGDQIA
jgi:preprotein translocase subunit YajC